MMVQRLAGPAVHSALIVHSMIAVDLSMVLGGSVLMGPFERESHRSAWLALAEAVEDMVERHDPPRKLHCSPMFE
jgi:hypothetical protein